MRIQSLYCVVKLEVEKQLKYLNSCMKQGTLESMGEGVCMCVCVCVCVCVPVCICTVYMYICTCLHVCVCAYTCVSCIVFACAEVVCLSGL